MKPSVTRRIDLSNCKLLATYGASLAATDKVKVGGLIKKGILTKIGALTKVDKS